MEGKIERPDRVNAEKRSYKVNQLYFHSFSFKIKRAAKIRGFRDTRPRQNNEKNI